MSDVAKAGLRQMPGGVWQLWVSRGSAGALIKELEATAPGVLPSSADRAAVLASLGYRPADSASCASGWEWQEIETRGGVLQLVGQAAVVALVGAETSKSPSRIAVAHRKEPLTSEELDDLLGPVAAGWPALGLTVWRGGILRYMADQQVKVFHGRELIGFTEQSPTVPDQRIYNAVVHIDHEGLPYGGSFPPGVIPVDPVKAQAEKKARLNS
ncbi:DUF6303 family protein [Streptomyces sp. NPDC006996]|uniref:DUF6303 family protein n=1 Tax=Streptomyces sp. NPDC006996 TaxID=3156908 RepID=UPI0033EF76AD